MKYIVALDQGTTSSRAIAFDSRGSIAASHNIEFKQIYPQPGWVEHDPEDIFSSQVDSLKYMLQKAKIGAGEIAAIGITNQRETTVLWDSETGKPLHNALVWQCRRTADMCRSLAQDGLEPYIKEKTGLIIDAYFSATKLSWLLKNIPGAKKMAEEGRLCFGTVDTFLLWRLTGGKVFATDYSNASRTMLMNINTLEWDSDLLALFGVPRAILPEIRDTSGVYGMLDKSILGREIPIAAIAGDQQAALFGQRCISPGMVKNTYGTGCFVLMNTGTAPVTSENRLLSTVAWSIAGKTAYALEGSVFMGGAVVQWLRDELKLIRSAQETEEIALSVEDSAGVVLVPAFTGLGAPYWDMYARGTIVGLTRGANRAHIVRAALESIAFQSCDVIRAMEKDSGLKIPCLKVDGGASQNNFLMQFQSDLLGAEVLRPETVQTTALGAAMLAGLAVGFWDESALSRLESKETRYMPSALSARANALLKNWVRAVERSQGWLDS